MEQLLKLINVPGLGLPGTAGCTSLRELGGLRPSTFNNKHSTIALFNKPLYSFPWKDFVKWCGVSTLECGICPAPPALLCTRDPPLQNCICVATMSSNAGMQIWIRISYRSMQTLTTSQWLLYLMLDHMDFLSYFWWKSFRSSVKEYTRVAASKMFPIDFLTFWDIII